jgi:branched-chain amino acid transport system permease protein
VAGSLGIVARRVWPLLLLVALVAAVTGLTSLGSASLDQTLVNALINLTLVVGLYIFIGNSGVFSFGHIGFMAIGAYVGALLTIPVELKQVLLLDLPGFISDAHMATIPAIIVSGLVAAAVAAVLAVPLMRLSGLVAALGTLAILLIVNVVARNWNEITNGTRGMSGIPTDTTIWSALVWALVAMAIAFAFQEIRVGRRLRASREDEVAARSVGVSVSRERGIAFVVSAFIMGIGGALYAQSLGSISPDAFFLNITFLTIAMLVVGGVGSLSGAVVGTIVVSVVAELFRRAESGIDIGALHIGGRPGEREVALAIVMLAILLLRPKGLVGGREITWPLGPWQLAWRRRHPSVGVHDGAEGEPAAGPMAEVPPGTGAGT